MKTWNERLKHARLQRGYKNLSAFAELVGVTPPTAHNWESRETKTLKGKSLVSVCKALNIRQEWLLDGDGPMDADQLSDEQIRLLSLFDRISARDRALALGLLEGMLRGDDAVIHRAPADQDTPGNPKTTRR